MKVILTYGTMIDKSGYCDLITHANQVISKTKIKKPTRKLKMFVKESKKQHRFETKLGIMLAVASDTALYLLKFIDSPEQSGEVERLQKKTNSIILSGTTPIIRSIQEELNAYFNQQLKAFKTPIGFLGTPFQMQVWNALIKIPYGETRSYAEIARMINKPTAYRAVAQANSANQLSIIIPCHRVINNNGKLGGYNGGVTRKQWLLDHEEERK